MTSLLNPAFLVKCLFRFFEFFFDSWYIARRKEAEYSELFCRSMSLDAFIIEG
jgi:hypothetical protein